MTEGLGGAFDHRVVVKRVAAAVGALRGSERALAALPVLEDYKALTADKAVELQRSFLAAARSDNTGAKINEVILKERVSSPLGLDVLFSTYFDKNLTQEQRHALLRESGSLMLDERENQMIKAWRAKPPHQWPDFGSATLPESIDKLFDGKRSR